jgi:uncharacterized phage-associated protein
MSTKKSPLDLSYELYNIKTFFLLRNKEDNDRLNSGEGISVRKLNYLLWYAQGIFMGQKGERLFEESFEAWEMGPHIRVLWELHRAYNNKPILILRKGDGLTVSTHLPSYKSFSIYFLEKIYEEYGQYSAWKLRDMTMSETPYLEGRLRENRMISENTMSDYFSHKRFSHYQLFL